MGHTLSDSSGKTSESVLKVDCSVVQEVEHVDSVDEDEVLDDVSQELAIVPLGHVHEVPVAEICVFIDPILIEDQVRSTIAHEGVVFGGPIPRILLAPIPPISPSSSLKVVAPSTLIIIDSIRGRIEDKRGRMMRVKMAFCGSNNDLDPGDDSRTSRFQMEENDVILKRKKKAPPWESLKKQR